MKHAFYEHIKTQHRTIGRAPKGLLSLKTIGFQVQAVSFREGTPLKIPH